MNYKAAIKAKNANAFQQALAYANLGMLVFLNIFYDLFVFFVSFSCFKLLTVNRSDSALNERGEGMEEIPGANI